jgi:hypothetical protein
MFYPNCKSFAFTFQRKPRESFAGVKISDGLLHQQHLTRSLDGTIEPALVMSWQTGVLAGQDPALVSNELLQQINVFEVERVSGEVDLRLGTRRAHLSH